MAQTDNGRNATKRPIKVGFRADAGHESGLGHIVRCLALANELRECGALCWFHGNNRACCLAARDRFAVVDMDGVPASEPFALDGGGAADVWVVDLQDGCPPRVAAGLRPLCDVLVVMNGVGYGGGGPHSGSLPRGESWPYPNPFPQVGKVIDPARMVADLVFYQGVSERPYALDWAEFGGEWYEGAKWTIVRQEFATHRKTAWQPHDPLRVFVSGGGANKGSTAEKIVAALADTTYEILVAGWFADVGFDDALRHRAAILYGATPKRMAEAMAWADVAVVAHGMTALECLCVGTPTLAFSLTEGHREGAELTEQRSNGALLSLGMARELDGSMLFDAVSRFRREPGRLEELGQRGQAFIDGKGVERVAERILEAVEARA